jgi:PAS domain S-box-containing protein
LDNTQQQFFESSETFKDLFDNAHDLIHIVRLDGTLLYVNSAWLRLLEYSQEEVKGMSIYDFVDEPDRSRFIKYRNDIIGGGSDLKELVVRFVTRSGEKVDLEGFVSVKLHENKPQYTRGIFRDITSKLKNEAQLIKINEELKEREANLQRLLHYAPDAVIVVNAESIITYWNPKAEEIFGWTDKEVLDKTLTDIIIPYQYRKRHDEGMKRYLATGEARVLNRTIEITALRKEGEEFFISLTISTTHQKGEIAFIAFIRDIDEQKRNALELEEKKKELEISNQELEQFAHVASHDMKEPIRKISMFSERLKSDSSSTLSAKAENYLDKVLNAALRLTKMVDGVLSYSTLKAEELLIEEVDLNEIVKSVLNDLELIIEEKQASIKYAELPVLKGSDFLLYQLFYNLINNALKFSKAGIPPVITVTTNDLSEHDFETFSLDKASQYVEITVEDNGIGFGQENAEMIFKTFFRLHSKDKYEGTGLGLALCKHIVDKHQGFITAVGKEGAGARFTIILPADNQPFINGG